MSGISALNLYTSPSTLSVMCAKSSQLQVPSSEVRSVPTSQHVSDAQKAYLESRNYSQTEAQTNVHDQALGFFRSFFNSQRSQNSGFVLV